MDWTTIGVVVGFVALLLLIWFLMAWARGFEH